MSALRDEIVESQKVRSDFLKWKLIIVSALGTAGLGLTVQTRIPGAWFILLLIPPACLYVDLMCRHLTLRIVVIGTFQKLNAWDEEGDYERFVSRVRGEGEGKMNVFILEDWALEWSTVVLSGLVIFAGIMIPPLGLLTNLPPAITPCVVWASFIISGLAGVVLTLIIRRAYRKRFKHIRKTRL